MYYYHSFAKQQVDLNWANPEVRQAMLEMLDFWIDQGWTASGWTSSTT